MGPLISVLGDVFNLLNAAVLSWKQQKRSAGIKLREETNFKPEKLLYNISKCNTKRKCNLLRKVIMYINIRKISLGINPDLVTLRLDSENKVLIALKIRSL